MVWWMLPLEGLENLLSWGCILWDVSGYLIKINTELKGKLCCQILDSKLSKILKFYDKDSAKIIFLLENNRIYSCKLARIFSEKQPYDVMKRLG